MGGGETVLNERPGPRLFPLPRVAVVSRWGSMRLWSCAAILWQAFGLNYALHVVS